MDSKAKIMQDGDHVHVEIDGKAWRMPWQKAGELGRALLAMSRQAEAFADTNRIIADQALLTRVGFPIGISNDARVLEAARLEAQHNRTLRRALPLRGVESRAVVGTPTLRKQKPC